MLKILGAALALAILTSPQAQAADKDMNVGMGVLVMAYKKCSPEQLGDALIGLKVLFTPLVTKAATDAPSDFNEGVAAFKKLEDALGLDLTCQMARSSFEKGVAKGLDGL